MSDETDAEAVEANENGVTIKPVEGRFWCEDVQPWEQPVDGTLLLNELAGILRRFVVLPKWAPEALALWVVHTYAYDLREVSTYVGVESPEKRCGKTTLLSVLSEMVNRPVVAANISSPAFFRVIEEARPTLVIDEADTWLQGNDELKGILNSGYTRKTAFVVRVAQWGRSGEPGVEMRDRGRMGLVRYSCWCPKVMAAIGRLPDTLADRCILIRMQRKGGREACERLRSLAVLALRRQCARFVRDNARGIAEARPELPAGLNDRAGDIWEPLLALADLAGGDWPGWARAAALELTALSQETNPIGSLLLDMFIVFQLAKAEKVSSRYLVGELNIFEDRPWGELRRGRVITEHWLARQLRPYGVRPKTIWMGEGTAKGYVLEEMLDAFRRYVPRSEVDALRVQTKAEAEAEAREETREEDA
jgi:putative DNA primase/helicase